MTADLPMDMIPALRTFARFLTGDPREADDLVHEALLAAVRRSARFARDTPLRARLFTTLRTSFRASCARRGQSPARPGTRTAAISPPQDRSTLDRSDFRAVMRLPMPYRETFVLVVILGESPEAAAAICGISVGSARSRVARARAMVATQLGDSKV